jgi:hypothetical protein
MCTLERFERINTSTDQLLDSSAFTAVMEGLVLMCGAVELFKNFLNSWISWQLPLDQNRRFRGTYLLYLQGGRNKFSQNRQAVTSSGKWRRLARWVSTDVSEEYIASIFRVEEISLAKTGKLQRNSKIVFFDISANFPAHCTRADWCLHASITPGSGEIIKHVLICRYGSRNEAWRQFTPAQSRLFCVHKPWSRFAHFNAFFQTWYHVDVNTALLFDFEDGGIKSVGNVWCTCTELHNVSSQQTALLILHCLPWKPQISNNHTSFQ